MKKSAQKLDDLCKATQLKRESMRMHPRLDQLYRITSHAALLPFRGQWRKPGLVVNLQLDRKREINTSSSSWTHLETVLVLSTQGCPAHRLTRSDWEHWEDGENVDVVDTNLTPFQKSSKATWAIKSNKRIFPNYN